MRNLARRIVSSVDRNDALVVLGLGLGVYGGWQYSVPGTLVTLGVLLTAAGLLGARR